MEPLPKEKRHPADYRDDIEHAEVVAALSELAEAHPARVAYCSAAISDSIALTHLLKDRQDLVDRLVAAYLAHRYRIWNRSSSAAHLASKAAGASTLGEP